METDFNFSILITELMIPLATRIQGEEQDWKQSQLEDQVLGEVDVPLSSKWIRQQVAEGELSPVNLMKHFDHQWNEIWIQAEEQDLDQFKNVANPSDYEKVEVVPKRASI